MTKNRALGKGLHSLLPQRQQETSEPIPITELLIEQILANPNQPRRDFRDKQLSELAMSIRADGVIQPLVVRFVNDTYELIAGERRLRAAKLAGLTKVPVTVQDIKDDRLLEVALIENIQREDLNPMELASALERMSSELGLNHDEIGARTGKDRATISNCIRLLQLPLDVQQLIAERKLTPGHARALLKLSTDHAQRQAASQAIAEGWTVRQMEEKTGEQVPSARKKRDKVEPTQADPNVRAAIDEMERSLGTRVRIFSNSDGKGRIEIEFYSTEDLDRIYSAIAEKR